LYWPVKSDVLHGLLEVVPDEFPSGSRTIEKLRYIDNAISYELEDDVNKQDKISKDIISLREIYVR